MVPEAWANLGHAVQQYGGRDFKNQTAHTCASLSPSTSRLLAAASRIKAIFCELGQVNTPNSKVQEVQLPKARSPCHVDWYGAAGVGMELDIRLEDAHLHGIGQRNRAFPATEEL
jgi:hypothetical protein